MSGRGRADDYDVLVDWDKRLRREGPFFRTLFERHGVRSVADVGAGSGRHAALFASWGLEVWAIDPSDEMLERAREHAKREGVDVRVIRGAFGEVSAVLDGPVDAVTCTGNALPHVDGIEGLRGALGDFHRALRPDGLLVLHLLNHHRILSKGVRTVPAVFRETDDGDAFYLRVMDADRAASRLYFDFVTLVRGTRARESLTPEAWAASVAEDQTGGWRLSCRRSVHALLPYDTLLRELDSAGFRDVELFGAHDFTPLRPEEDESVIVVAVRA
ncbi:MAG: class I SAM-dependent methyltransferase [Coriobacteriia bacterium]|nr:class I SAM-dependent methyltransferase [Coriobacteriia bacterium]